ncbi:MAG: hypothetical protein ACU0B9_20235 [Limimaricola soesokkakensis]|uniref:hypothetical protein n=1 Tax=Limimaricola soesokkakensis TaxID=1343159 RepID=UPI004058D32D
MPIINIPTERIEKYLGQRDTEGYVDDRHINPEATEAFNKVLQVQRFGQAPFFETGHWRFYEYRGESINLSNGMPEEIATKLDQNEAADRASAMQASQWLSVIRNALAHGGVIYLDEHGRSSHDAPIRMFGFVNGKYTGGTCPHQQDQTCRAVRVPVGLNILRISVEDYRDFLRRWVDWMQVAGLVQAA